MISLLLLRECLFLHWVLVNYLLGHAFWLQAWASEDDPVQASPPFCGCVPTVLDRERVPPLQDALQVPQDPQLFHSQSTTAAKRIKGKKEMEVMKWFHYFYQDSFYLLNFYIGC